MRRDKGIILAGGSGTRLYPVTLAISKQLLPVYDKPMIYYPLSTLMLAGIRDILIISHAAGHRRASSSCSATAASWGIKLAYAEQPKPDGLAQAFIIGAEFIGDRSVRAGAGRQHLLRPRVSGRCCRRGGERDSGATVFAYHVSAIPERYGVVEFDERHGDSHRGKAEAARSPTTR